MARRIFVLVVPGTKRPHEGPIPAKNPLSLVFRIAVENGRLPSNPILLVRRLREDNGIVRFLSADEGERLRAVIQPEHPERWAAVVFAMNTGLRAGEQWKLDWSDVTLQSDNPQIKLAGTKNGTTRYVPLNESAVDALAQMNATEAKGRVFPQQHYRGWFDIALADAGIERFTWHCLRHTFASRLVMAGVDLRTVAELMGHKSLQMTIRYAHLTASHAAEAMRKLAAEPTDTKTDTTLKARARKVISNEEQVDLVTIV